MRSGLATLAAIVVLASGCAVAPHGGGASVTHDVVSYLQREWPLAGAGCDTACGDACSCCDVASAGRNEVVYIDDWDQPGCHPNAYGYTDDPPPAVPLEPAPPGRFFPVPVRPAFAPQGPSPLGIGSNLSAEGTGV